MEQRPLSLEDVAQEFAAWRASKKARCDRTPPHLMAAAVGLHPRYPVKQILRHLTITPKIFEAFQRNEAAASIPAKTSQTSPHQALKMPDTQKTRRRPGSAQKDESSDPLTFVSFGVAPDPLHPVTACQILKPDGTQLILKTPNFTAVIRAFLCSS